MCCMGKHFPCEIYSRDLTMVKSWWDSSLGRVLIMEAQSLPSHPVRAWMCMPATPAIARWRKAILGFYLVSVVELVSCSV